MKDLTDPTTIVEGLRLIAGVSDGPDPETGESYDTMNELMTNAANTLERLTAERDQARAEVEQMHARTDHATVELLALGRELRQAREERDRAAAEAAGVREVLIDVWHRFNQHVRPATSLTERVEKSLDHTLATRAAAVLASAQSYRDTRRAFLTDLQDENMGTTAQAFDAARVQLEADVDAYRSALADTT